MANLNLNLLCQVGKLLHNTVKIYIPTVGTELELAAPWKFKLYQEYRNGVWIERLKKHGIIPPEILNPVSCGSTHVFDCDFVLPPGTKLKVSRVYIRGHARNYDSVTFTSSFEYANTLIKGRFWAKLADVNTMEVVDIAQP